MVSNPIEAVSASEALQATVSWLRNSGKAYRAQSRIANRQRAKLEFTAKGDALMAAADFLEGMRITRLPRSNKCPNCGEELL